MITDLTICIDFVTFFYLEVGDGVGRGEPGRARVLLGAEGPVEGLGDGTQVEGTHRRCCNTVALDIDRQIKERKVDRQYGEHSGAIRSRKGRS